MGSYLIYKSKISFFLMFFKNYHIIFSFLLINGTIIAISSNSWFTSWLGLEINLIRIIPLILINLNRILTEAAIKYFLTQALASILLIFSISLNFYFKERIRLELLEIFIIFSLTIKTGLVPLHFWFPQVAQSLNWTQCFILFTWQKVAPLILLATLKFKVTSSIRAISAVIGSIRGFNQFILKLILTYSSISHRGWILIACYFNFNSWSTYFLIYSILSASIIRFFYINNTKKINQIFLNNDSLINKNSLILNLLSLGGLPPLLGFAAKLNIILCSLKFNNLLIFLPLIAGSIISLFFYTRVVYRNLINDNKHMKIFNENKNKLLFNFSVFTILINSLIPSVIILR